MKWAFFKYGYYFIRAFLPLIMYITFGKSSMFGFVVIYTFENTVFLQPSGAIRTPSPFGYLPLANLLSFVV